MSCLSIYSRTFETDHAAIVLSLGGFKITADQLLKCASDLGDYDIPEPSRPVTRSVKTGDIDTNNFINQLPDVNELWGIMHNSETEDVCREINEAIYSTAVASRSRRKPDTTPHSVNASQRWQQVISSCTDKQLWAAINWSGTLNSWNLSNTKPSDMEFCTHFESLLNPVGEDNIEFTPSRLLYVPVLDDAITPFEVDVCIKKLKPNKSAGVDGIVPGILKTLPDDWILLITYVFNMVFISNYPMDWTLLKVFTIYKKGPRQDPQNYRGISIVSAIPKLYDMVLSERFALWYVPKEEQAGAQMHRGCEEQILTIRLLIDIARKTKKQLYIAYIDYQKAYDRVSRQKLLQYLEHKGCGSNFLRALNNSMEATGMIGHETFNTSRGVKQGGSSSCKQFVAYIDPTIYALRDVGPDDWLGDTHILLLMDDTVLVATSREKMTSKLRILKDKADHINMLFHRTKCQYMVINSTDSGPFTLDDVIIEKTNSYVYLGAQISNDTIATQVKNHVEQKQTHIRKFTSFLTKNSDCPYHIKNRVWNSALNAAVLYSCETWMTTNLRPVEAPFMNSVKQMLSVRVTTCNDIVHAETGIPSAKAMIVDRQRSFLKKLRTHHTGDYVTRTLDLAIHHRTPMGKRIQQLESTTIPERQTFFNNLKVRLTTSTSTRRQTYFQLNPLLRPSAVLHARRTPIMEHKRISVTRMRLGSHYLRCETGRWSRTPREERLCICQTGVQDEEHVLLRCPRTEHIRVLMNMEHMSLSDLFNESAESQPNIAEYCYKVLNLFGT